jgi:transposase InsO family protein
MTPFWLSMRYTSSAVPPIQASRRQLRAGGGRAMGIQQGCVVLTWIFVLLLAACAWLHRRWRQQWALASVLKRRGRRFDHVSAAACLRCKPEWVVRLVIGLGVHGLSCRAIAANFNRRFGHRITIGKSWVAEVLKVHAPEIADRRRAMRRRPPIPFTVNHTWALDVSFYTSPEGVLYAMLGIIDHGSRRLLCLKQLPSKCTLALLGYLFLTMARLGVPSAIRTDNEGMFRSALWKAVFKALNIRHLRSAPYCPWQNGRIERLFGTLKPLLRKIRPASGKTLRKVLKEFTWFYNEVRVHQNLKGLTPMEAWQGKTLAEIQQVQATQAGQWVSALDGLMTGYYVRCR